MEKILLIPLIASFFVTIFVLPIWIRKAKQIDLIWEDMNKPGHPKNVAGSGGVVVLFAFITGVLMYIGIKTFVLRTDVTTIEIFALTTTILIAGLIGIIDDFLGWARGGLSPKSRILLMLIASIPLMAINSGESVMMGVDFGTIYPLVFIPLGIVGATTTFNFLAGYNGLEAGQGIIILSFLSLVAYWTGNSWISMIGLCMIASLLAFLIFNKFPAKIFPGDVLTYSVGALIAIMAILGNFEKIAVFVFIPYIIETVLKSRGKLKKQSFAKVNDDGSLEMPHNKIYSLNHLAIKFLKKYKKKVYEKDVVYSINLVQVIICLLALIIFRGALF